MQPVEGNELLLSCHLNTIKSFSYEKGTFKNGTSVASC